VGIDADHHGEPRRSESWGDALRRFYEREGAAERRADLPPAPAPGPGPETPADDDATDGDDETEPDAERDDSPGADTETEPKEETTVGGDGAAAPRAGERANARRESDEA
jgi:hypothetical protein